MLRLLLITILLSSVAFANVTNQEIENTLTKLLSRKGIKSLKIKVIDTVDVPKYPRWKAYMVHVDATIDFQGEDRSISQVVIWFGDGKVITENLLDPKTKKNLKNLIKPKFKDEYYDDEHLFFGNKNAKHKVAIFSDPLCPFCRRIVPDVIKYVKKYPNKFAVYYYHLPLEAIHPASQTVVEAAIRLQNSGKKDYLLKLYKLDVRYNEMNKKKILDTFNKAMGTNYTLKDIKSKDVLKKYKDDVKVSEYLMVHGTPTLFLDGKVCNTKEIKEAK